MGVEQNNFRDMLSVYLPVTRRRSMCLCIPGGPVTHTGLAGEEWLKAFLLQIFRDGDGGNVRIVFTAGGMSVFPKYSVHGASVLRVSADDHDVSGSHNQNDWLIA